MQHKKYNTKKYNTENETRKIQHEKIQNEKYSTKKYNKICFFSFYLAMPSLWCSISLIGLAYSGVHSLY